MKILEDNDFLTLKLVLNPQISLWQLGHMKDSEICDYPLHLGITEVGGKRTGSIKSSIGMGNLFIKWNW